MTCIIPKAFIVLSITILLVACGGNSSSDRTVILLHGGGWHQGYPERIEPIETEFAAAGWRTENLKYPLYPEVSVEEQIQWVRNKVSKICQQPEHCVLIGNSAGSQLALKSSQYADAVIGLSTGLGLCAPVPEQTNKKTIEAIGKKCKEHEPSPPDVPTLLWHAKDDQVSPIERARLFADVREGNETVQLWVAEKGGHDFWLHDTRPKARKLVQWVDDTLNQSTDTN